MDEVRRDEDTGQPVPTPAKSRKPKGKKTLLLFGCLILICLIAFAGWWWRDKDAKKLDKYRLSQISELNNVNSQLTTGLADAVAKTDAANKKATVTAGPSANTLDNIKDSINSGNTAALESYTANKVLVAHAASDGIGHRSARQTVSDITSYLKDATAPWDFDLSTSTLNKYSSGDYAQYFSSGSLVGQSKNDYVISFTFNNAGKVSVVFMSVSADLL